MTAFDDDLSPHKIWSGTGEELTDVSAESQYYLFHEQEKQEIFKFPPAFLFTSWQNVPYSPYAENSRLRCSATS